MQPIETQVRHLNKRNLYPHSNTVLVEVDGLEIEVGYESEPPEPSTGYHGHFAVLYAEIVDPNQLEDIARVAVDEETESNKVESLRRI